MSRIKAERTFVKRKLYIQEIRSYEKNEKSLDKTREKGIYYEM